MTRAESGDHLAPEYVRELIAGMKAQLAAARRRSLGLPDVDPDTGEIRAEQPQPTQGAMAQ